MTHRCANGGCRRPYEPRRMGRPQLYCSRDCRPSYHVAFGHRLMTTVIGKLATHVDGKTPSQLADDLLAACPRCGVPGPKRLLLDHLRIDHAMPREAA